MMVASWAGGSLFVAVEVLIRHQTKFWSLQFGVLARTARRPPTNNWRKYHLPAFASGISAVQISPSAFFHPEIFRPPLRITFSPGQAAYAIEYFSVPESCGPKTSVSLCR